MTEVVALAAASAATVSFLAKLAESFVASYLQRGKLLNANELEFDKVLASDSLEQLGAYLEERLGTFTLSEYAQSADVRSRVDRLIGRVTEFATPPTDTGPADAGEPVAVHNLPAAESAGPRLFDNVASRLRRGLTWDAMALLRRELERDLQAVAETSDVAVPVRAGAGTLLRRLSEAKVVDDAATARLRYAIGVANRAVHGEDVSTVEAYEALECVEMSMAQIRKAVLSRETEPRHSDDA